MIDGSIEAFQTSVEFNPNKWKYTSGVIAFRDNENPSNEEKKQIIKNFKATYFAGMPEDSIPCAFIEHRDKGNLEIHFLASRMTTNFKSFNMNPPGQKAFELTKSFQSIVNEKHNIKVTDDMDCKGKFDGQSLSKYADMETAAFVLPESGYFVTKSGDKVYAQMSTSSNLVLSLHHLAIADSVEMHVKVKLKEDVKDAFSQKYTDGDVELPIMETEEADDDDSYGDGPTDGDDDDDEWDDDEWDD